MKPLISLLIPTRGRHTQLAPLVENVIATCEDLRRIEILFKIDSDDFESRAEGNRLVELYCDFVSTIVTPRPPRGYNDIHLAYNELAECAWGTYLWVYNDDVEIVTRGWDGILQTWQEWKIDSGDDDRPDIIRCNSHSPGMLFPIIHRDIYDTLGVLGVATEIDVQYEILGAMVQGIEIRMPTIEVQHNRIFQKAHELDGHPIGDKGHIQDAVPMIIQHAHTLREKYAYRR